MSEITLNTIHTVRHTVRLSAKIHTNKVGIDTLPSSIQEIICEQGLRNTVMYFPKYGQLNTAHLFEIRDSDGQRVSGYREIREGFIKNKGFIVLDIDKVFLYILRRDALYFLSQYSDQKKTMFLDHGLIENLHTTDAEILRKLKSVQLSFSSR